MFSNNDVLNNVLSVVFEKNVIFFFFFFFYLSRIKPQPDFFFREKNIDGKEMKSIFVSSEYDEFYFFVDLNIVIK